METKIKKTEEWKMQIIKKMKKYIDDRGLLNISEFRNDNPKEYSKIPMCFGSVDNAVEVLGAIKLTNQKNTPNADGELLGGVADMTATEGMTPEWLAARRDVINSADAVVADANSSDLALAWLIDNCEKPLYLDAVSVAKASRIKEALELSCKKSFFALKCNALEYQVLSGIHGAARIYISVGAEGLRVMEGSSLHEFPALPCIVRSVTGGGDALLAGIIHAGPSASIADTARWGLECARCAVESPDAVNPDIARLAH